MPQDSQHPDYQSYIGLWTKCRTVAAGEEAVKAAGTAYLPALEGQQSASSINEVTTDYESYKQRAVLYGATGRTIEGLGGLVMRKSPEVGFPTALLDRLSTAGRQGETLEEVADMVITDQLEVGRIGLLVDATPAEDSTDGLPAPYVARYAAESVINWREEVVEGALRLTMVMLCEYNPDPNNADPYANETVKQYRELDLSLTSDPNNPDAEMVRRYRQRLWQKVEKKDEKGRVIGEDFVQIGPDLYPRLPGGKTLDFIPFTFINAIGTTTKVSKPPLLDLVNTVLSHYHNSADLEHGLHYTALPVAYAVGFPDKSTYRIGSSVAWTSDDPNAKAGYLEFTGAGLGVVREVMADKERMMAILGARLLETQKRSAETAEAMTIRQGGETAALEKIVTAASDGLTKVLRWFELWLRGEAADDTGITLNNDLLPQGLTAQQVIALMQALQSGALSFDAYFHNMQRGEMYPDGWTKDDEMDALSAGLPLPEPTPTPTTNTPPTEAGDDEGDDEEGSGAGEGEGA